MHSARHAFVPPGNPPSLRSSSSPRFDPALIPIGGYSDFRTQHPNHVNPEEAVQLFEDVGGLLMVPMHWGTFDFNLEPLEEPPARLRAEAVRRGLEDRIVILRPGQTIHW